MAVTNKANRAPMSTSRTPKISSGVGWGMEPPLCHGEGPGLGRVAAPEEQTAKSKAAS